MSLPETVLHRLVASYSGERDSERAAPMRAYMRDQFPFLGIPNDRRRALSRQVLAGLPRPAEVAVSTAVREFVASHTDQLSPLSVREALKNIRR
jgi:3-methyladenine DNA glycosylase AlkD